VIWGEFLPSAGWIQEAEADIPGLVTAGICNLCIASSLAEFLSAYPTLVYLEIKGLC
jgi:hypothetical protein